MLFQLCPFNTHCEQWGRENSDYSEFTRYDRCFDNDPG